MLDKLKLKSKQLLESREVNSVLGTVHGTGNRIRPMFIREIKDIDNLIINESPSINLAAYIAQADNLKKGKVLIIASMNELKAIKQLSDENRINDEQLRVIGVIGKEGIIEFNKLNEVSDYIQSTQSLPSAHDNSLEQISSMTQDQRWQYWKQVMEGCIRCYACRSACPLCYCERCAVEINQPQWVSVASHTKGNFEWHIMRAIHLAGRCVGCQSCSNACPINLPIHLLNRAVNKETDERFGKTQSTQSSTHCMSSFSANDFEDFIK